MFKKLRIVIYPIDNLQKAKEWYKKITGIDPYFDEMFYVDFDINGCEPGLDPDSNNLAKGEHSVAYWKVDDINQAVCRLNINGAKLKSAIQEVGEGISVAVAEDPFGNFIGLPEEK